MHTNPSAYVRRLLRHRGKNVQPRYIGGLRCNAHRPTMYLALDSAGAAATACNANGQPHPVAGTSLAKFGARSEQVASRCDGRSR